VRTTLTVYEDINKILHPHFGLIIIVVHLHKNLNSSFRGNTIYIVKYVRVVKKAHKRGHFVLTETLTKFTAGVKLLTFV